MKTSILRVAIAAMAMAALAGPLSAQESAMERIRAALPPDQVQAVEQVLARARQQNLPTEPLMEKALEGVAKHAPPPLIVQALNQLSRQLGEARALLKNGAPPAGDEVAAVADALRRGVPAKAVRTLHEQAGPGEPVALAVHTLGDLLDRGVPVNSALDVLKAWREHGARADELREIPAAVEGMIRQGEMPGEAAAAVASAVRAGQRAGAMGTRGNMPNAGKGQPGMNGRPPVPPGAGPPSGKPSQPGQHKPPQGPPPLS
ncbi:MAG: hypothetical protein P8Z36_11160 [Gemmatimonadota bacterium]